ncbi:centrosome-associated protein 350-like isoform X2 [Clavelina lepadiformis]|uniref:centrosome-associated protein 350-like isoform X2 n=1 Tax=Clavelina lepadiformis TaxID=159417 RepID=UPI0040427DB9
MESSIRSRNITEPKLHSDWSTEKKHPYPLHGDYNSNEHVSAYIRSNRPKDQETSSLIQTKFREPVVSFREGDFLSSSQYKYDKHGDEQMSNFRHFAESVSEDPKDNVVYGRNLNSVPFPSSSRNPNTLGRNVIAAGITRTVLCNKPNPTLDHLTQQSPVISREVHNSHVKSILTQSLQKPLTTKRQRKKLEENSDGLAKLKETILKQKENRSPVSARSSSSNVQRQTTHPLADIPMRKIAAGPAAPTYLGFNAPEVRVLASDGKVWKADDLPKTMRIQSKPKTKSASFHAPSRRNESSKLTSRNTILNKSQSKKRTVRKIGKIQSEDASFKKSIITPASWKEGHRIASAILGSNQSRTKKTTTTDKAKVNSNAVTSERTSTSTSTQNTDMVHQDIDDDSASKKSEKEAPLGKKFYTTEAKAVLDDLFATSDVENDHVKSVEMEEKNERPKQKETKKIPPATAKDKDQEPRPPKSRHYDQTQVQLYMAKQKEDRRKKQAELRRHEKETNEKIARHLNELDKRQRETRKRKIKAGHNVHKNTSDETFTREAIEKAVPPKPERFEKRIAAFMERLEAEQHASSSDSSQDGDEPKQMTEVSPFLLKLEECLKESGGSNVASDRDKIATPREPEIATTGKLNSSLSKHGSLESSPRVNVDISRLSSHPISHQPYEDNLSKSSRIASLKAKSQFLQERIERESRQLLEKPVVTGPLIEELSLKVAERFGGYTNHANTSLQSSGSIVAAASPEHHHEDTSLPGYHGQQIYSSRYQDSEGSKSTPRSNVLDDFTSDHQRLMDDEIPKVPANDLDVSMEEIPPNDDRLSTDRSFSAILRDLHKSEFCGGSSVHDSLPDGPRHAPHSPRMCISSPKSSAYSMTDLQENHVSSKESGKSPWKQTHGDKYSVMNVFTQKYIKSMKNRKLLSKEKDKIPDQETSFVKPAYIGPDITQRNKDSAPLSFDPTLGEDLDGSTEVVGLLPRQPTAENTNFEQNSDDYQPHSAGFSRVNPASPVEDFPVPVHHSENDDHPALLSASPLLSNVISNKPSQLPGVSVEHHVSTAMESADYDSETTLSDRTDSSIGFHPLPKVKPDQYTSTRFSPAVLECKMALELNRYDAIDEQLKQLEGSEHTQGIAMAQQETVSLAEILKSRQLQHEYEMERLTLKAKEEAFEANQKMSALKAQASAQASSDGEPSKKMDYSDDQEFSYSSKQSSLSDREKQSPRYQYMGLKSPSQSTRDDSSRDYTSDTYSSFSKGQQRKKSSSSDYHSTPSIVSEQSITSVQPSEDDGSISENLPKESSLKEQEVSGKLKLDKIANSSTSISEEILSQTNEKDARNEQKVDGKAPKHQDVSRAHFDDTLTEDEIMELSQRAIIPSESYRRFQRRKSPLFTSSHFSLDHSDVSISSDDTGPNYAKGHPPTFDESKTKSISLFGDSEFSSFSRFMKDHVRQYMLEQEVRSQHQSAMLRLREKAIKEKTQAELAWLELKKRQVRNKGEDDKMPPLKKKKRAILLRLQVETEEIKKLRAANKAASQDRELMLLQQQDINRIMLSTQQIKEKLKGQDVNSGSEIPQKPALAHPVPSTATQSKSSVAAFELDELSESDLNLSNTTASRFMVKLKKAMGGLDDRRLTAREKALLKRKKEAERLLEWKRKLDKEEEKVFDIEQQALSAWNTKEHTKGKVAAKSSDKGDRQSSAAFSVAEDIAPGENEDSSSSRQTVSKLQDISTEDTLGDYHSQSFEATDNVNFKTSNTITQLPFHQTTPSVKPAKSSGSTPDATTPLISQTQPSATDPGRLKRRDSSEFWSDESFSQTQSETEQSDVECRVHALKEELKRRRLIADRLKKQKHKEHLRAQEASLKSQIEAYDAFIKTTQQEIYLGLDTSHGSLSPTVIAKPQIRSPRKSDKTQQTSRTLRSSATNIPSPDVSPRAGSQKSFPASASMKQRSDSESSGRSSRSLTFDEDRNSPEDATTPNGTSKSFLQTLPSRHHDKHSPSGENLPHARPNKLDIFSSKSKRNKHESNKQSAHISGDKPEVLHKTELNTASLSKAESSKEDYLDDTFEKDSIATEEEIGEQLSEIFSEKSDLSAPLLKLTNETHDEDKTPVASPLMSPDSAPSTPTPRQTIGLLLKDHEHEGIDICDGTTPRMQLLEESELPGAIHSPYINEKKTYEVISDHDKLTEQKHEAMVDEICSNILHDLIKESIRLVVNAQKSADALSSLPEQQMKPVEEVDQKQPRSPLHPKLTSSAKNLLQQMQHDSPAKELSADKSSQVTEALTSNILDDAIAMAFAVRKDRKEKWLKVDSPIKKALRDHESSDEVENIVRNTEEVEPVFTRPVSPVFGTSQESEEWFDDDFGLSDFQYKDKHDESKEDIHWPNKVESTEAVGKQIDKQLIKVKVPCKQSEIMTFVDKAFEHCYAKHNNEELLAEDEMPVDICDADGNAEDDNAGYHTEAFRRSVFDLVRDLLLAMYKVDVDMSRSMIWQKVKRKRTSGFFRSVPSTKEEALMVVRNEISRLYSFPTARKKGHLRHTMKWGNMKKKDNVDLLLIEEMREEEPSWTDYDMDETSVKVQLTDTVFDMLLNDTISSLRRIETRST